MGRVMDRIVWIDCEMTGLELGSDALIEVAALVTDSELTVLGEGVDIVISCPDEVMGAMIPFVRDMHASSGLTEEVKASVVTMEQAQEQVLAYIKEWVPEPNKAPLAGNSIATDRGFLARDMPELDAYLHYRMVDVSSVKELARRWYPKAYYASPEKNGGHRALADIIESIEELRYYRGAIFVSPGEERLPGGSADETERAAEAATAAASAGTTLGVTDDAGPSDVTGRVDGSESPVLGEPAEVAAPVID